MSCCSGEVLGVGAGSGCQRGDQWRQPVPAGGEGMQGAHRCDGLVGKGQSLRFAGPDVDFSEKQPGDGLASAVVALAVGADRVGGDVLSGIKSA